MRVFISWSGEPAGSIANVLKTWLPKVVPDVKVWLSSDDIAKGSLSLQTLTTTLDEVTAGIFVVTPENQHSQWLNYEAGSIAVGTSPDDKAVWVLRVGLERKNLTGPLTMFQSTSLESKKDVGQLVRDINLRRAPDAASNPVAYWYENAWSELQTELAAIESIEPAEGQVPPDRPNDELIGEILELARATSRTMGDLAANIQVPEEANAVKRIMNQFRAMDARALASPPIIGISGNPLASASSELSFRGLTGRSLLPRAQALLGQRVQHSERGIGTIMQVVGTMADPEGIRAIIQFDGESAPREIPMNDFTIVFDDRDTRH